MLKDHAKVAPTFADARFAGAAAGAVVLHLVAHQRAFNQYFALVIHFKKIDAAQQGALAGTGGADKAHNLLGHDVHVNPLKHLVLPIALAHIAYLDGRSDCFFHGPVLLWNLCGAFL